MPPNHRRPWILAVATLVLLLTHLLPTPRVVDAATLTAWSGAELRLPTLYIALAPLCDLYDQLSLLSKDQHIAFLATLLLSFALWRVLRRRDRRRRTTRAVTREIVVATAALAGLVAFYAVGVLVPRPMAALTLHRGDELAVDFHSHTDASHDGRRGFDSAMNRRWHHGAGFNAAFITDHSTWKGWRGGAASNPDSAGAGTLLLPGVEVVFRHGHGVALGSAERYAAAVTGRRMDERRLSEISAAPKPPPTLLLTLPAGLRTEDFVSAPGSIPYLGVELRDASPRGIEQAREDRQRLVRLADSLDLALVAGSNNHGWGWTAESWTVMRIPGWRGMDAAELTSAIEHALQTHRRTATRVVARWAPDTDGSALRLALTAPAVLWAMLTGLTPAERLAWIAWIWVPTLLLRRRAPPDRRRGSAPRPG